jgi:prepilin-type processing-associated H-X9-DG protein
LVVISILVLLMALLLPTLHQVRKRAKAAGCQANLRQWGVVFCMYMNEHNDRLDIRATHHDEWWRWARPYYGNTDDLLLCPMATRYELNKNDPAWETHVAIGWGMGSKFTAWKVTSWDLGRRMVFYGSYGLNYPVISTYSAYPNAMRARQPPARSRMPFLLDCVYPQGSVTADLKPPAYDGDLSVGGDVPSSPAMKWFCIDRHDEGINSLFVDWSVRRVGFKELWTLKWYAGYDTGGPWTKAGGVRPEDWPRWMRRFKDY